MLCVSLCLLLLSLLALARLRVMSSTSLLLLLAAAAAYELLYDETTIERRGDAIVAYAFAGLDLSARTRVHRARTFKAFDFFATNFGAQHFVECRFNTCNFTGADLTRATFTRCALYGSAMSFIKCTLSTDVQRQFVECTISDVRENNRDVSSRYEPRLFKQILCLRGAEIPI